MANLHIVSPPLFLSSRRRHFDVNMDMKHFEYTTHGLVSSTGVEARKPDGSLPLHGHFEEEDNDDDDDGDFLMNLKVGKGTHTGTKLATKGVAKSVAKDATNLPKGVIKGESKDERKGDRKRVRKRENSEERYKRDETSKGRSALTKQKHHRSLLQGGKKDEREDESREGVPGDEYRFTTGIQHIAMKDPPTVARQSGSGNVKVTSANASDSASASARASTSTSASGGSGGSGGNGGDGKQKDRQESDDQSGDRKTNVTNVNDAEEMDEDDEKVDRGNGKKNRLGVFRHKEGGPLAYDVRNILRNVQYSGALVTVDGESWPMPWELVAKKYVMV